MLNSLARWCAPFVLTMSAVWGVGAVGGAADETPKPGAEVSARFKVPEGGVPELLRFLKEVKLNRPRTQAELQELMTATRTAADRILELEKDANSAAAKEALVESLQAGSRLVGSWDEAAQRKELARVEQYLAGKTIERAEIGLALGLAQSLEYAAKPSPVAGEAYEKLGAILARHGDARAKELGATMAGAARRLNLVGNPLELTGTKLDGAKFDIKDLKGKVVLIDFWATWCGPCLAEYPNIKKSHETYSAQGFEVVGVSIDEDRDALESYVKEKNLPWITLHEKDAAGRNPATNHYGILGIPAMFLVDREGKVVSIRARGEELNRLLAAQFPDAK